jgi:hypothetical protein
MLSALSPLTVPVSGGHQVYGLSILSCLRGLHKAMALGWYTPDKFDLEQYEHLKDPLMFNMHEVSPKFVACKGPVEKSRNHSNEHAFPPEHFVESFRDMGVTAVIRLNDSSTYNAEKFTEAGLRHYDLNFDIGSVPSITLVKTFFEVARCETRVAVHCKSGLGRTGTLIGAYLIKYHGFAADEAIGWLRIVRPGSVQSSDQNYLHSLGSTWSVKLPSMPPAIMPPSAQLSVLSPKSRKCQSLNQSQVAKTGILRKTRSGTTQAECCALRSVLKSPESRLKILRLDSRHP